MSEEMVEITVDGETIDVSAGSTILAVLRAEGIDTPTICWAENLTPVNVCRACVVEVEGSRTLVPSCSRPVESGMVIHTDSERVRHSRRMVLEFLATANDLSEADEIREWATRYGADSTRYPESAARVDEPPRRQDELYVRDYDKCVQCYKCIEACGDDAQHTFAIAVSGRGFESRISTEFDVALPDSACVYCGNCVGVCPTNALVFTTEFDLRRAGVWKPDAQTVTRTVCSYCGVGCNLDLHVQDDRIVKVTSPADHEAASGPERVTLDGARRPVGTDAGMLCIKGRFGWTYVHA